MHYDKPPISFQQQVEKLKTRGMQFKSESTAIQHLSNISYYRLRAYTYLWNRRFTAHIILPSNPQNLFIQDRSVYPYKLYAAICCIQYMLNSIFPGNCMGADLIELMRNCPFLQEKEMGFPVNWEMEPFWQLCNS